MEQNSAIHNIKQTIQGNKEKFKSLKKETKIAILVGIVGVLLATVFSITYSIKNKYDILFSGLDTYDAANIAKELEDKKIDTKVKGDTIYVPKKEVDKLRIELSPSITNGSNGFELMDSGSGFGMTDEEFLIKKLRMIQGELEKTIKTFPQVSDARVHITNGEESVFAKDTTPGKAAVYLVLKSGQSLEQGQIRAIMSLVSASSINIPKKNVEVIDQNMTLLSDGIFDAEGNVINGGSTVLQLSRQAEANLSKELQNTINEMLEPIFGKDKVKVAVNASLNLDTSETTEIKLDPEKVISSETRSESSTNNKNQSGSPVDDNMSNTAGNGSEVSSKEENIEYEIGKTETKTITTPGKIEKITASVAIDGVVDDGVLNNVRKMVASALGIDPSRGDDIAVVAMKFNNQEKEALEAIRIAQEKKEIIKFVGVAIGIAILLIVIVGVIVVMLNKRKNKELEDDYNEHNNEDLELNKKIKYMEEKTSNFIDKYINKPTLEDEVKQFASKNPQEVTELLKVWLNE